MKQSVVSRESNIELLRIISMFFILVVHANFYALGKPTVEDAHSDMTVTLFRQIIQALSFIGVHVFILISGWFSIKLDLKKIFGFVFQCVFILSFIYIVTLLLGYADWNVHSLANCFLITEAGWFIRSYLFLCILSPLLNAFVREVKERQFLLIIILFFIFQTLFEWVFYAVSFFQDGYSPLSFVGLYLLARYMRCYASSFIDKHEAKYYLIVYILLSLFIVLLSYFFLYVGEIRVQNKLYSYLNPLIILSALSFFIFFVKLKINSRLINKIAASCFAVYLVHNVDSTTIHFYLSTIESIYENSLGINGAFLILFFLIFVFFVGILVDQIRLWAWKHLFFPISRVVWHFLTKRFTFLCILEQKYN